MDDVAIITPTSDRPLAFRLCERWMERSLSHYSRAVRWYVVDDGLDPVHCTMGQIHIQRPHGESNVQSFLGNLLTGLRQTAEQKILFVEDDDWYSANYITLVTRLLDHADIVGESCAKYYSFPSRRFTTFPNTEHASLCQTGIRRNLVDALVTHIEQTDQPYVDIPLWKMETAAGRQVLMPESRHCIGMKGLPGKVGISEGHGGTPPWENEDPNGDILRSWIGCEDAELYFSLFT